MQERKRYHWLDWLRFAAAFGVIVCHTRGGNWTAYANLEEHSKSHLAYLFFALTRPGLEYVVIFFILSGFLVGGKVMEKIRKDTFDLKAYVLDRVSRIFVPLLPALLFTYAVNLICHRSVSLIEFLGNVFGLQGLFCNNFAGNDPL